MLYLIHWATGEDLSRHAGKTGGRITARLVEVVDGVVPAGTFGLEEATEGAERLLRLNNRRNDILHSRPATIGSEQRLDRWAPDNPHAQPGPVQPEDLHQFIEAVEAAHDLLDPLFEDLRRSSDH